jgi:hypothetical protein
MPFPTKGHRYSRCARGRRPDLGETFWRSSWEANYARYLNWLTAQHQITQWEYEPQRFVFSGETRGPISYTPDFRVTYPDGRVAFHEVKGWMDRGSKSRITRMRKHYPKIPLEIVGGKEYRAIEKEFGRQIPHWEFRPYRPRPRKRRKLTQS